MVDILLVGLHPSALVADQGIGHGIFVDLAVGGHLAAVACAAYQLDASGFQHCIERGQGAGIVAGTEIDAYRILLRSVDPAHVRFQPVDIFYRHEGYLFQHIGRGADSARKRDDSHAVLHDARVIAHSDAPDAGNTGVKFLQGLHMLLELGVVRQQHDELGAAQIADRFRQIPTLAHSEKLPHTVAFLPLFRVYFQPS